MRKHASWVSGNGRAVRAGDCVFGHCTWEKSPAARGSSTCRRLHVEHPEGGAADALQLAASRSVDAVEDQRGVELRERQVVQVAAGLERRQQLRRDLLVPVETTAGREKLCALAYGSCGVRKRHASTHALSPAYPSESGPSDRAEHIATAQW